MDIMLDTPRLKMRAFREEDFQPYAAMCADPEVMRYLGTGATFRPDEAWRSIAAMLGHWRLRGYGMWALERKDNGALIGRAGFIDPPGWPGFELGWTLARSQWRQGFASEAAQAALRYAFEVLERDRVISLIRPANAASIRVAQRLGMQPAGEMQFVGSPVIVYEARR
jgi:RimJ/RimL family protein N-acetyltransferase